MNHANKATAHEIKIRRVAYFYSAAERRSRGALWPSFAPALIQTCREAGLAPESIQEITQFTNAIGLVSVGMGVALVPLSMAALKRDGVAYVELEGRTPLVETLIVRSPGEPYPAMRRLIDLARACSPDIVHHQSED